MIFWVRVLNWEIKRLRRELTQTRHSLAMYQSGNILAGLRRELADSASAYEGLRKRHNTACSELQAARLQLEGLIIEEQGVNQPDET